MVAAKKMDRSLVVDLIEAKADPTAKDPEGKTAIVLMEEVQKERTRKLRQEEAALRVARVEPASQQRPVDVRPVFEAVGAIAQILSALR
jgi:hypothetical protein